MLSYNPHPRQKPTKSSAKKNRQKEDFLEDPPRSHEPPEDSGNAGSSLVQRSAIPRASAVLEAAAPTNPCLALPAAIELVYSCTVLAAVTVLERSLILERARAGLRNARAKGRRIGRPGGCPGRPEDWLSARRGQLHTLDSRGLRAFTLSPPRSLVHKTLAGGESRRAANAADEERAQSCPGNMILHDPARTRHRLESQRQAVHLCAVAKSPGLNALR